MSGMRNGPEIDTNATICVGIEVVEAPKLAALARRFVNRKVRDTLPGGVTGTSLKINEEPDRVDSAMTLPPSSVNCAPPDSGTFREIENVIGTGVAPLPPVMVMDRSATWARRSVSETGGRPPTMPTRPSSGRLGDCLGLILPPDVML